MSYHENINAKRQFTKECFFSALMILMQQKDYKEISITELAKKAGFCRMAFYRNYDSILDVIVDYLETNPFAFDDNLKRENFVLERQIRKTFSYFRENKVLIDNLIKANLTYLFMDTLDKYFKNEYLPIINDLGFVDKYEISTFIGMCYKIIIDWAKTGMDENEMDKAINQAIGLLLSVKIQRQHITILQCNSCHIVDCPSRVDQYRLINLHTSEK